MASALADFGPAYTGALARSDRLRVSALLTIFAVTGAVLVARSFLTRDAALSLTLDGPMGVVLFGILLETTTLVLLRGRGSARRLPSWFWLLTLMVECTLPTASMLMMWKSGALPPDRVITAPSLLFYAIFTSLSTLHLRPALPIAAGFVCASQHAILMMIISRSDQGSSLPAATLVTYPVALVLVGVASAFVASRLRQHLRAALDEARHRRRAEDELAAASRIQQNLMPAGTPDLPGYDIAGWNRPASETGGDYFDWQTLPEGQLVVSLADVTGHGLGPAIIMAFCRAYARATMRGDNALDEAVQRVNRLILDDLPPGHFVTYVAALLRPDSGRVDLVSAGHGPLFVSRSNGHTTRSNAHGLPLGVTDDSSFEGNESIELNRGDAIVLMTDGFFEWSNSSGDMFGTRRLEEAVRASCAAPASEMIHAMLRAVEAHAGDVPQPDDLTAVVIKRL